MRVVDVVCILAPMATSKRTTGRAKAPAETDTPHVPDLVIRGLTADDVRRLEDEHARRMAALPKGAKITRNAVAVAVLQEALAALEEKARADGATP